MAADGTWSATPVANSLITPANTYYRVVEGAAVSPIVVPAAGGPYSVGSILVTPPPTPSAPGILAGGASAPTMTTVYTQASGSLPSMTVRVGPGQWIEIDGTVIPSAQWTLD